MAAQTSPLDIRASLRGERIFITGATGFVGKALVEKLLWAVPGIRELLLLVRPSDGVDAAERLKHEVLDAPLMARLRALHAEDWKPWANEKISVIEGDLAQDHFGLKHEAYESLATRVDRVVASAATVNFDERLDRALELNARGALRTLQLARDAGGVPLLHLSTCFVSGSRRALVEERVTPPKPIRDWAVDANSILASLEAACRQQPESAGHLTAVGRQQAQRYGFHDTYTLTKALGERLIEARQGDVPVAILRPAIIESAVADPIPGWIEGVRVTDPLIVAYARGAMRDFPGAPETPLELVPVDHVVNATIAALAAIRRPTSPSESPPLSVYQVASRRNPINLGELVGHARDGFTRSPMRNEEGEPIVLSPPRFVEAGRYQKRLAARRARARRLARVLGSTRWSRRFAAAERTLGHFHRLLEIYRPYFDHGASYDDSATRGLWSRLPTADREVFPFDITSLDWGSYIAESHVPGLQRFALRTDNGAPPPPRVHDSVAEGHARGDFPAAEAPTLYELFSLAAEADPTPIAFQTCRQGQWLRYTYGQALTAIHNIAARLEKLHGIGRGDRVVIWGSASPEWVLTSFAVHRLGAVTVPLDPQWPADEVLEAAAFTQARMICAAPGLDAKLGESTLPVATLRTPFVPEPEVGLLPGTRLSAHAGRSEDVASILFTSGTTVAPKAVPLTHANILSNVKDLVPVMRSSRERLLSVLPIHHVFEFTVGLLVPIVGGGTISYVPELKPAEISWMMNATRPTMLVAVPRLLELLHNGIAQSIAKGGKALAGLFRVLFALSAATGGRAGRVLFGKVHRRFGGSLRRIATGGSALEPALARSFQLMGFQVAEGYGMTETSPVLTVNPWSAIRLGSAGLPLPSVEIDIRPISGEVEGTGQVWVRGPNVMPGYYRNEQASSEAFDDGWLDTGDIGRFDRQGYLHLAGRSKDVIVTSAGKNIYPEEVEYRYRDLDGVEELIVLGLPTDGGGECVAAVIVPKGEADGGRGEAIREALAVRSMKVPSYQRISRVEIWRGSLPKTTTMKVQRGHLREALLSEARDAADPRGANTAADTPAQPEETLSAAATWASATLARLTRRRADLVRPADRLAELGVDSLTHVELVAEIEGHLGVSINDEAAANLRRVQDVFDLVDSSSPLAARDLQVRASIG